MKYILAIYYYSALKDKYWYMPQLEYIILKYAVFIVKEDF